jgi:hypothetical protein
MIPLFDEATFQNAKIYELLPLKCKQCGITFERSKMKIWDFKNPNSSKTGDFCSPKCAHENKSTKQTIGCHHCGTDIVRTAKEIKDQMYHFCSSECSNNFFFPNRISNKCTCNYCKKEFTREIKNIKNNKSGIFYCSNECYNKKLEEDKVVVKCSACKKEMKVTQSDFKNKDTHYCSTECNPHTNGTKAHTLVKCKKCGKDFEKKNSEISRSDKNYCSRKCFSNSNNTEIRSKMEIYIENELIKIYPHLKPEFNKRDIPNFEGLELDIYIDILKLGFELNGVVHYQQVWSYRDLNKQIERDQRKVIKCVENNINLHILDVRDLKRNRIGDFEPYLEFIIDTINFYNRKQNS